MPGHKLSNVFLPAQNGNGRNHVCMQILEAKEAGASGVLGIVTSILGKHAALYSSYAAQFGLDCPVEVRS